MYIYSIYIPNYFILLCDRSQRLLIGLLFYCPPKRTPPDDMNVAADDEPATAPETPTNDATDGDDSAAADGDGGGNDAAEANDVGGNAGSNEDEPASEPASPKFAVGDKVEARFKGGENWYAGSVTNIDVNNNYDVRYDDGDVGEEVSAPVRHGTGKQERASKRKREQERERERREEKGEESTKSNG